MPLRPAERRLRAVTNDQLPEWLHGATLDPLRALADCAAYLDQKASACDDEDVAQFLRCEAASVRLEAFSRQTGPFGGT